MSRFRRSIETRLLEAVVLVLANGSCQPPLTAARGPSSTGAAAPLGVGGATAAPAPGASVEASSSDAGAPDTDAEAAETADTSAVASAPPDARALCAAYQARTPADGARIKKRVDTGQLAAEASYWDVGRAAAVCTIVRERVQASVEVTRTPTCCPQSMGNAPCPPPRKVKVPGVEQLVERVEVRADGTAAASALQWEAFGQDPEPRRYCGRRPEGLRLIGDRDLAAEVGLELAQMAELEAASVPAFARLARELALNGAPAELVERVLAAMLDEVRHAEVASGLAAERGARPRAVAVEPLPCRSLAEIARENAIEGCVHEAWGALVVTHQAARADPALRGVFAAIAADERSHVALAEDVHAWLLGALDASARAAVLVARAGAEVALRDRLAGAFGCAALGVPDAAASVALFDAYFAA